MSYTANQILGWGAALIQEKVGEDPDSSYFTPYFLTIALEEVREYENMARKAAGLAEMDEAPIITQLTDRIETPDGIPFRPKITRVALPYLLASHFFRDNNDSYHEQLFYSLYQSTVMDDTPFVTTEIEDYYA